MLDLCGVGIKLSKNGPCHTPPKSTTEQVPRDVRCASDPSPSAFSGLQDERNRLENDLKDLYDSDSDGLDEKEPDSYKMEKRDSIDSPIELKEKTSVEAWKHASAEDFSKLGSCKQLHTDDAALSTFRPKEGIFVWTIPEELLFYIGLRLGWEKSAFCCEVSKKWCAVLRCDAMWSAFLRQRSNETPLIPLSPISRPQVLTLFLPRRYFQKLSDHLRFCQLG